MKGLGLPENYSPQDVTIDVKHEGDLGLADFYCLHCTKCNSSSNGYMLEVIQKHRYLQPNDHKLVESYWFNVILR